VQYFQAVKIGKERAGKSQMALFNLSGFAMLTLTTKKKDGQFVPVGDKDLVAVIKTSEGFVTILVDEEGYTKAQSKPLEKSEAMDVFRRDRAVPDSTDQPELEYDFSPHGLSLDCLFQRGYVRFDDACSDF